MTKRPAITAATKVRAIGYVRVSTDKQADFGVSLEAQAAKVRAMAEVQDAELLEVISDAGTSAKNLQHQRLSTDPGSVRARCSGYVNTSPGAAFLLFS